jgi:deoxyguanosine kinase
MDGKPGAFMYFAIEGVIGVGKTTLVRLLQPAFQANILLEVFEENPFLSNFYADRARYAFQTQIFFLLSRYHQQHQGIPKAVADGSNLISDYTFEKDVLFARINLQGDELEMYYRVHEALAEKIQQPNLTIYLRAETKMLMQRIAQRDRPYERDMDPGYIEQVNQAYDDFFINSPHSTPVLVLDTNNLDYVRYPEDLRWVENRIRQAMQLAPFQPELPLPNHD